jgi:hypothetical protein
MQETTFHLYSTSEAVAFLQKIWGPRGVKITKDKFYHAVLRSGKEYKKQEVGKAKRYRFREEELRELRFHCANANKPRYEHVKITTLDELSAVEAKYGELINEEGIVSLLMQRFGKEYAIASIRQRLRRGDIDFAAYGEIGKYKTYWYPLAQFEDVRFYPKLVKSS